MINSNLLKKLVKNKGFHCIDCVYGGGHCQYPNGGYKFAEKKMRICKMDVANQIYGAGGGSMSFGGLGAALGGAAGTAAGSTVSTPNPSKSDVACGVLGAIGGTIVGGAVSPPCGPAAPFCAATVGGITSNLITDSCKNDGLFKSDAGRDSGGTSYAGSDNGGYGGDGGDGGGSASC